MKWIKRIFDRWLEFRGYYQIDRLTVGGNCGCCGSEPFTEINNSI